jgi:hypothetical protein
VHCGGEAGAHGGRRELGRVDRQPRARLRRAGGHRQVAHQVQGVGQSHCGRRLGGVGALLEDERGEERGRVGGGQGRERAPKHGLCRHQLVAGVDLARDPALGEDGVGRVDVAEAAQNHEPRAVLRQRGERRVRRRRRRPGRGRGGGRDGAHAGEGRGEVRGEGGGGRGARGGRRAARGGRAGGLKGRDPQIRHRVEHGRQALGRARQHERGGGEGGRRGGGVGRGRRRGVCVDAHAVAGEHGVHRRQRDRVQQVADAARGAGAGQGAGASRGGGRAGRFAGEAQAGKRGRRRRGLGRRHSGRHLFLQPLVRLQQRQEDHLARARGARAGAEDEGRPRGVARRGRRARQPPGRERRHHARRVRHARRRSD